MNFLFNFWVIVFCRQFLKKWDVTSKTLLLEYVVLWSPDWGNTEKHNYHWASSKLQLTFFLEYNAQFLRLGLNQNCYTFRRVHFGKFGGFFVLRHNPYSPKFLESAIIFVITFYPNWRFGATSSLISTIKVSIENPLADDQIKNN